MSLDKFGTKLDASQANENVQLETVCESNEDKLQKIWNDVWLKAVANHGIAGNINRPSDLYASNDYQKRNLGKEVLAKVMKKINQHDPGSGMAELFIKNNFSQTKEYWQDLCELIDEHRPDDMKYVFDCIDEHYISRQQNGNSKHPHHAGGLVHNNWKKLLSYCLTGLVELGKCHQVQYATSRYLQNKNFNNKDLAELLVDAKYENPLTICDIYASFNDASYIDLLKEKSETTICADHKIRNYLFSNGFVYQNGLGKKNMGNEDRNKLIEYLLKSAGYSDEKEIDEHIKNHAICMGNIAKDTQRKINNCVYAKNALGLIVEYYNPKEYINSSDSPIR